MKVIRDWKNVLVTCPHNLGDFISKLPFIRLLKAKKPDCKIILCSRKYIQELVECVKEVDDFLDFEAFFQKDREDVIEALKDLKVDTVVHLLSVQKMIGPDVLSYAKQANILNRIGNLNKSGLSFWLKRNKHFITHNVESKRIVEELHEFQWNLLPLKFFGISNRLETKDLTSFLKVEVKEKIYFPFLSKEKFNLILHPGSHGNAKEWPKEKFIELIEMLDKQKFQILVTGSKDEAFKYKELDLDLENVQFLMGQLSLKEFISLIEQSEGLVAASTGPIHIASLFSTPTLALFPKQKEIGPSVWRPLGENASYLESPSICLACEKKLTDFNQKLCTCMEKIEASEVKKRISLWRGE